jgi:hypothetical protein
MEKNRPMEKIAPKKSHHGKKSHQKNRTMEKIAPKKSHQKNRTMEKNRTMGEYSPNLVTLMPTNRQTFWPTAINIIDQRPTVINFIRQTKLCQHLILPPSLGVGITYVRIHSDRNKSRVSGTNRQKLISLKLIRLKLIPVANFESCFKAQHFIGKCYDCNNFGVLAILLKNR